MMANLTQYLGGKEIKAVVGETYDPQSIGQAPTAALPAGKSLGDHKAGEAITESSAAATSPAAATGASPAAESTATPTPEEE
jgi:hypothetical protein